MRRIPATMATQHPDNASAPYWEKNKNSFREATIKSDGFVSAQEELVECVSALDDLGIEEFMWDWEGKHADEAVIDKLFTNYYDFCKKNNIGNKKFLTFRVPNIWHEQGHSLLRAFMVMLTSEDLARDVGFRHRPLFEIILPMTENAEQLIYLQRSYQKLARFKYETFNHQKISNNEYVEIIPLVESVAGQVGIRTLLDAYVKVHCQEFGKAPAYLRPFLARSDPAMISGLVATVLGNKIALSEMARFSADCGIPTYPIIGVGSLVFRGGLAPGEHLAEFMRQYAGVRTVTIQSGFRYDYPRAAVKRTILELKQSLWRRRSVTIPSQDRAVLERIINKCAATYQATMTFLIKDLNKIFAAVPRRRERKLHIGFLSYGRHLGKNKLPRAINFTAAFYSLGLPPEFIGLGRTLATLSVSERVALSRYYPILPLELERAGRFLNRTTIKQLTILNHHWQDVAKDVALAEQFFSTGYGPKTKKEKQHALLTERVLKTKKITELVRLIEKGGRLRKSLG